MDQSQNIADREQEDSALPLEIRRDLYLVGFSDAMKIYDYEDAVFYAELLERTGLPVDDSLYYFWGEALLELGQSEQSIEKLTTYLSAAGNDGQYYTQALTLLLQAREAQ